MESREQGYEDDRFQSDVSQNLHCVICLNVFKDPVMCQRNEHCFCRPCITRHLKNSRTCPTCKEELTLETLNRAPRILRDWLSELYIRCEYFNQGCREFVLLGDLETHVKNCGFSRVVCSNQIQIQHETEFRKVRCLACELRKDMDEIKTNVTILTEKLDGVREEMKINQSAANEELSEMRVNLREIRDQLATLTHQMPPSIPVGKKKAARKTEQAKSDSGKTKVSVVIAGGLNERGEVMKSVEKFCWSSKWWSPLRPMKECRQDASSFVFENRMIVTGGYAGFSFWGLLTGFTSDTNEIVCINPAIDTLDCRQWFDFPAKLPAKLWGHKSVVYNEQVIIIGGDDGNCRTMSSDSIHGISLVQPCTSKLLTTMPEARFNHGAQLFNDKILICGGKKSFFSPRSDSVIMYDIGKNKFKQMSPLPYVVSCMATVRWGDNVIVIGGNGGNGEALNTVVSYNVKTGKSQMLPGMKYRRRGCVAVVVDNSIVVMGGIDERDNFLNSVESFSFGSRSWSELPPMREGRFEATAVAW